MKKTILAIALAASMVSGCSMMGGDNTPSYADLQTEGQALLLDSNAQHYAPSHIQDLEKVRLSVNAVFLIAEPMYEKYTEKLINSPEIGNFTAATEAAETEAEKKAIYDALTPEVKKEVDDYLSSSMSKELMKGAGEVTKVILKNSSTFAQVDTKSLLSQVDFSNLMAEKDNLSFTTHQLAYLDTTLVSAYKNYQVVSAFSNAQ